MTIHIDHDQVSIEQLGSNSSFLNQIPLKINQKEPVKDGDLLHLLENEYGYTIRIERAEIASPIKATLKRQNTDDEKLSPKKQKTAVTPANEEEKAKETSDDSQTDEPAEENRLAWIQEQLNALQEHAQPPYDRAVTFVCLLLIFDSFLAQRTHLPLRPWSGQSHQPPRQIYGKSRAMVSKFLLRRVSPVAIR